MKNIILFGGRGIGKTVSFRMAKIKEEHEWELKSMSLGKKVSNRNQYELACAGASQEVIDKDIPVSIFNAGRSIDDVAMQLNEIIQKDRIALNES